ncbi:MAG: S8 family serine peptidase [Planctomycetes bacterium]|nr:S8 family serine peptidase [Planctomycetota bacterium]
MWTRPLLVLITSLIIIASHVDPVFAQTEPSWTQLSLSTCGVDAFLRAHPKSDGRGVVIAILDTGVDPSIPGLTQTPDCRVKVVDVQDFTGDGDVELDWIRPDPETGKLIRHDEDGVPVEYEPPAVPAAPGGEERRWWFGLFKEKKFVSAAQSDLNGNGKTDDEFAVLVTALEGDGDDQAICWVDTDVDRSFADEKAQRNYKLNFDTFVFRREKPEKQIIPLTFAVNIFLRQAKVVFHFDNGGHGTHVAGIAAGYRINDQDGFHGVAPGARLMSLKIGCGWLGGVSVTESKRKALRYADRYARQHDVPVVCNLSYGVASEIEGHSDIDEVVDRILRGNPRLVFVTSAGNGGPGLSTVGTPAAATEAISVGALMAADTGRDVSGWTLDGPVVTVFSSRGGELDKPDIATPGWATSTVPRWVRRGDFWAGTSMASPYAAGLCANLISHAAQSDPKAEVWARDVRRALCLSGRPVPGLTPLDYGYGVPDLPGAAEFLARILAASAGDPVVNYEISTPCPQGYRGSARAAYWRGTWFPCEERQTFTIKPVFAPTVDMSNRTSFTRRFELRSTVPWMRVPQETFYLRGEQDASVFVEYHGAQLAEPGVHVGAVEASVDGLVALRLLNTVVVPYRFGAEENFTRHFKGRTAEGWTPDRYFFAVPPGASAMRIVLSAPEEKASKAMIDRIFDPAGRQLRNAAKRLDTDGGRREVEWTLTEELTPGVWEVPVVADRPDRRYPYDLEVQFFGLHADPPRLTEGKASRPAGALTATMLFERPVRAIGDGRIEGFRLHSDAKFKGLEDDLSYSLALDDRFDRLRLKLEMTPEDYATTTDIAVIVKDGDGEAIHHSAFDVRTFEATIGTQGKKSLTVVIHGGFAVADDKRETPIAVQIDSLFASPVGVKVTRNGEENLDFIPSIPVSLEYSADADLKDIPEGQRPVGYIRFRERSSQVEVLRVPIDIGG